MKTLAVDAMGGDHGAKVVVPAAIEALDLYADLQIILVGDETVINSLVSQSISAHLDRLTIRHASEVVEMNEKPSAALRYKKNSSMRIGVNSVKEGMADAFVSAGNTGALMATSKFVLKTVSGIDRPAIIYALPTIPSEGDDLEGYGTVHMLDLGANVECTDKHLFQFAIMGSVLRAAVSRSHAPRVCLLNIGEEEIKGLEVIKDASAALQSCDAVNYCGYIEANDILSGKADVIVCDGFVGNIALKTIEGVAKGIGHALKSAFHKNMMTKLSALGAMPVMSKIKDQMNPNKYNGASLIGLRGIVIKSHGSVDAEGFLTAIGEAVAEIEQNIPQRIERKLETLLRETEDGN